MIGRIAAIWRHPVKSMRGEPLTAVELRWTGLAGDRQYGFLRPRDRSRAPWLTGRVLPQMLLYRPQYAEPDNPRNSALRVHAPDGSVFDIWDEALIRRIADGAGQPVQLVRLGRGAFDQHPVSVISTSTLRRLERAYGSKVDLRRFRMNIVIETDPDADDLHWTGRTLAFGDAEAGPTVRIDEPNERCVMITIDPDTAAQDPTLGKLVSDRFGNDVGHYGAPVRTGRLSAGDPVFLSNP